MDIKQVVKERRSIRRFKTDQVPESLIKEILDEARWSPSWGNTQPSEFYVLTGEALKKFKAANLSKFDEGIPSSPDIRMPESWMEQLKKRYSAVGKSTLDTLGLAREDAAGRKEYARGMYRLFDAPCLIVACVDKRSSSVEYALLDVGLFIQTLCLLAHDRGLGTCIEACAVRFPAILRDILPDAEDKLMVAGIALGYPEPEAPINNFKRERAPLEEVVTWVK
ncbi:MAG: nitroreductase [Syntrophales bacterium]|nr:nitroreductase [Syntrophales bacterium]